MSTPSSGFAGSVPPHSFVTVGKTSISEATACSVRPAGIFPGQRAMNGSRTPPS